MTPLWGEGGWEKTNKQKKSVRAITQTGQHATCNPALAK